MDATRQLWVFAKVAFRQATRGVGQRKPKLGLGAALTNTMLRLLFLAGIALQMYGLATMASGLRHGQADGDSVVIQVWGYLLLGPALCATIELARRQTVGLRYLTDPSILGPLPLRFGTEVGVALIQLQLLFAGAIAAVFGWTHAAGRAWPSLSAVGLLLALASCLCGIAFVKAVERLVRPTSQRPALQWSAGIVGLVAFTCLLLAPFVAGKVHLPLQAFAVAVVRGQRLGSRAMLPLAALAASALLATWLLELRGGDRLVITSARRVEAVSRLDLRATERLLIRRQGGRAWTVQAVLLFAAAVAVRVFPFGEKLADKVPFVVAYLGYLWTISLALQQAQRDARARPLLAALPIAPADTVAAKTPAIRRTVLPLLLCLLPSLASPPGEIWWRSGIAAVAILLLCWVAPAVAFLANLARESSGVISGMARLELMLVSLPLFSAVFASRPVEAVPSLLALGLLTFEARRAASLRVRWLDDAGPELERETPVWRALVAFATFIAVQGLVSMVALLGGASLYKAAAYGYLVSGVVLLALTLGGRAGFGELRLRPRRWYALPVGLLLGGLSGELATLYLELLTHLGVELPADPLVPEGGAVPALLIGLAVVAAPLVEETFFRGWLQPAIGVELPARHKRWAFALAAFAFAAVHPPVAFAPVFFLGLVAGLLYDWSGGLLAGMCAHAMHNAVVTLLASP